MPLTLPPSRAAPPRSHTVCRKTRIRFTPSLARVLVHQVELTCRRGRGGTLVRFHRYHGERLVESARRTRAQRCNQLATTIDDGTAPSHYSVCQSRFGLARGTTIRYRVASCYSRQTRGVWRDRLTSYCVRRRTLMYQTTTRLESQRCITECCWRYATTLCATIRHTKWPCSYGNQQNYINPSLSLSRNQRH